MSTQTPEPQPQASAGSGDPSLDSLFAGAPTDPNGTSTADKYGLGQWGQEPVNTTGLFNLPPGTKADDVMRTFLQAGNDPNRAAIVAAIQHALYLAGDYYPSTYTPVSGLIRPTDAQAFAKFLTETAQTNSGLSDEAKKPLTTALVDASAMGAMAGTAQVKQVARRAGNVVTVPSATDLAAVAQGEARKVLGRNASDAQVKAFVNYYQNVTKDYQQQLDQAQYSAQYDSANPLIPKGKVAITGPTDVNRSGIPLSAADQSSAAGQGQPAMDQGGFAADRQLDNTNGQYQQPTPPLPSPTDFMGQVADIVNAANSSSGVGSDPRGPRQAQPSPYVVNQAPDPSTAADAFLRTLDPADANANDLNSAMGTFLRVISSGRMQ
jgi:hypothetical protein